MVKANSLSFNVTDFKGHCKNILLGSSCIAVFEEVETEKKLVNAFVKVLGNLVLEKSVCKYWLCLWFLL